MTEALINRIKAQLVRHQGLGLQPFRCTAGKLTIVIGLNLDFCGISQKKTYTMLQRDIQDCDQWLIEKSFSYYWQGLAKHTALRIREFVWPQSYKKTKAKYYKLVEILDDHKSDIYRALAA